MKSTDIFYRPSKRDRLWVSYGGLYKKIPNDNCLWYFDKNQGWVRTSYVLNFLKSSFVRISLKEATVEMI